MENNLFKKLHFKQSSISAVIDAPVNYLNNFSSLSKEPAYFKKIRANCDFIQYFVSSLADLEKAMITIKKSINKDGIVWITYPKQSSGVKTDINRDTSFSVLEKYSYTGVSIISIDDTWSALRIKPLADSICKKKDKNNDDIYSAYINNEKRIVMLPEDLKAEFDRNKKALFVFNLLAFTHKKEFILWILEAKREQTRSNRVKATINLLLKGSKTPFN